MKLAFDEEGIEIPYNYLNVHLTEKQNSPARPDSRAEIPGEGTAMVKKAAEFAGRYMKGSFGRAVWSRISSIPLRRL